MNKVSDVMNDVAMAHAFRPSQRARRSQQQPISQLMAQALADPELISLAAGFVDQATLPDKETARAFADLCADPDLALASLQYGTTPGDRLLRELIVERACAIDSMRGVTSDRVVVTAGSNQLLHLVAECLLDPGDIVICASPTYLVFLGIVESLGARSFGVAIDQHGMIPAALDETMRQLEQQGQLSRVKAIYLVPYFDNPCGITMPAERTAQIIKLAQRWSTAGRIHVIADEAYRELRYEGPHVPGALVTDECRDTVIVAGTFSKSFSPGIRVGWGLLPSHLVEPVCNQKGNLDFGSPNLNQCLMARILELGLYDPHIQRLRASYQAKRDAMLEAAETFLSSLAGVSWNSPAGGLYLWASVPEPIQTGPDGPLFAAAIEEGVLYVPGQFCFPHDGESVRSNTMRLSFGVQSCPRIQEGIQALARAIDAVSV